MAKIYDVVARIGEYDGKGKFKNVGMINKNKEGHLSLLLTHPLTINDDGQVVQWYSLFEPKEKDQPGPNSQSMQEDDFEDDDVPF